MMLADSVEAASRSLDDPSHKQLKSLIDLIFRERIDDGQLDETNLTFQDLRLIKDTFLKMLMGIYHVRVKYPDQEEEETEQDETPSVVSVGGDEPYDDISVKVEEGLWGEEPESETGRLDAVPGFRDPREPRPQLAEASPHSRVDRRGNARPDFVSSETDDESDSSVGDASSDGSDDGRSPREKESSADSDQEERDSDTS